MKDAVGQAERITQKLESFLQCSKDRLGRLKASLNTVATKSYFSLLSDNILAIVFEFASVGEVHGKPDYRTPSRISRVSHRFREITLRLPRLWRFIDSGSQSLERVRELAARNVNAGSIFEVRMRCKLWRDMSRFNDDDWQEKLAEEQIRFFSDVTTTLSSRITSLHFDYDLESDFITVEKMAERIKDLSFPALEVLRIDHEDPAFDSPDDSYIHFYQNWDLPALKVLKALNIVPRLRPEVLAGVLECSLSIGRHFVDSASTAQWELSTVMVLLGGLLNVKVLKVDLHGELVFAVHGGLPSVILPTVEILSTSFVGVDPESAKEFRRAFSAPNKQSWTVEIEDNSFNGSLWHLLDDIFPYPKVEIPKIPGMSAVERVGLAIKKMSPSGLAEDGPNRALREINLIIHREFGRSNCDRIRRSIPACAGNLENFSVTYANGEQGFFSKRDEDSECTVQVRKVELKNCKGMVEQLLMSLEDKFVNEPWNANSRLVLDGSEVQKLEYPGIDGGPSWASLVLDAKIIRED